nr:hemicentin-1-like [Procambarus clarkii]
MHLPNSIDARSGPEKRSEHWSDLGGRAHFRMTPSAASPSGLVLSHVTPADQGLYRCRVDFVASPTRNVGVELRVVDPPRHLVILDVSGRQVNGLIGPYPLGDTLSLTCQVTAGSPRPEVTWWHEGSLLDGVVDEVRGQVTHNLLTLPNLTRQHLHRVLTCRASNSNLTAPLAASVTLDMTFPPLEVRLVGNNTAVREGGLYPLVCEATGSRPPANLTWWINGVLTSTTSTSMQVLQKGNVSRSTLQLSPSRRQDGAVVSCRAENPRVQAASALEDSRKLLVYYSPRMRLRPGRNMDMNKIREGDDVYFDCHIEANPRVLNVMWHLDGSELEQNVPRGVIQSNQSLVLQSVSRASTGTYSCSASNLQGSATSNTLRLNVKFAPVCSPGQKWVYGGSRQQPVNVSCQVEAYPEASSFRWAFNTSTDYVEIPPELIHGSSGASVVSYTPQTHHDFGSLLCWGRNEVDAQRQPCVFHVVPAGVPEPVNNCSAWHNVSASGQVMVGCQAGWGGGLSQTFTLEVRQGTSASPQGSGDPAIRPPGTVLAALRDQLEPHFTVTGLTPGKEYFLAVIASNSQGSAPPTVLVHLTPIDVAEKRTSAVVAEASSGDELEKVMPVMGAVVGVIVGVVLCGVALVVGVRLRAAHGRTPALTRIVYGDQAVGAARAPDDGGFMQQKEQKGPDIILVKGDYIDS